MNNTPIEIKINSELKVVNADDIIKYINGIEVDDLNKKEWLTNLYNNFKSNRKLSNTNRIIIEAQKKLKEMGVNIDHHGNFNPQNIIEATPVMPKVKNQKKIIITEESLGLAPVIKDELESVSEFNGDYLKTFAELQEKESLGEILNADEVNLKISCLKSMLNNLSEAGYASMEYVYLKNFFADFIHDYYEKSEQLNNLLREMIEKFISIDNTLKHNDNVKKLSPRSGVISVIILLEIAIMGIFSIMFLS